jgi:hypothetical protein
MLSSRFSEEVLKVCDIVILLQEIPWMLQDIFCLLDCSIMDQACFFGRKKFML